MSFYSWRYNTKFSERSQFETWYCCPEFDILRIWNGERALRKPSPTLYPGLVERARNIINAAEKEYDGDRTGREGGFLWEHTVHVASLAHDLALTEGLDPVLPAVTALFHDAGKFRCGEYHNDESPEEEGAAALASASLEASGARASDHRKGPESHAGPL